LIVVRRANEETIARYEFEPTPLPPNVTTVQCQFELPVCDGLLSFVDDGNRAAKAGAPIVVNGQT
jgi:hypothetical protein